MGDSQPRRLEERLAYELGLALMLFSLALVQVTLLPRPFGVPPALILVLAVCRSLTAGLSEGVRWAFYGGLALDIWAPPLGSHGLALLLAIMMVYIFSRRLRGEHWLLPIVATFGATLIYEGLLALIHALRSAPLEWSSYLIVALLPGALLAIVPALPIYMLLRQVEGRRKAAALEL